MKTLRLVALETLRKNKILSSANTTQGLEYVSMGHLGPSGDLNKKETSSALESAFSTNIPRNGVIEPVVKFESELKDLDSLIMVTDNHNVLKMPSVVQYNNDVKSSVALEKAGGGLKYNLHKKLFTQNDYKTNKVIALTNKEKFKVKGQHTFFIYRRNR